MSPKKVKDLRRPLEHLKMGNEFVCQFRLLLSAPSDDRPSDAPRRTVRPRAAEKKRGKKAGKAQPPLRKPSECRSSAANANPPRVGMKRRNEVDDRAVGPKRMNNAAAACASAASASAASTSAASTSAASADPV
ncbi:hypothetical protein TNCV_1826651 [Trichonephila clavipes]|nr:hypothetical protein TNCV_1826651 [Trichonephila clavipes]